MTEITIIKHDHTVTVAMPHSIETIAVERDPALAGMTIRLTEAAARYAIPETTLSGWAARGLLRIVRKQARVLELDEGDVSLAARLYHALIPHVSPQHAGRVLNTVLA